MTRRAIATAGLALSLLAATTGPVAADSSFSGLISGCPLVVLARVSVASNGGVILHVERVLKGHAAATLRFPPSSPAVQAGWARAVVAFSDPSTIAGGVTHAWHVAPSGAVDPEHLFQLPGIPQTLAAMLAWFGSLPATDTAPSPAPPSASESRFALIAVAGLLAFVGTIRFDRRRHLVR